MTRGLLVVLGALLLLPAAAPAATITVDSTEDELITDPDDEDCSLREAIESANTNSLTDIDDECAQGTVAADKIQLIGGTYSPSGNIVEENTNVEGDFDIGAVGDGGPLMIDGTGVFATLDGVATWRLLDQRAGELTLRSLIITNGGGSPGGGAIRGVGGNLTLEGVTVIGNNPPFAQTGGGIDFGPSSAATLSIADSVISGNGGAPLETGGGITVEIGPGALEITDSVISQNSTSHNGNNISGGGGIFTFGTTVSIVNSTIADNTATTTGNGGTSPFGGGLYLLTSGQATIRGSLIEGNQVIDSSTMDLDPGGGGVLRDGNGGALSVLNSTFVDNDVIENDATTIFGGGGLYDAAALGNTTRLTHVTMTGNESPRGDALVFDADHTIALKSSIIEDADGVVTDTCATDGFTTPASGGYNIARGTTCPLNGTGDMPSTNPDLIALGAFGGQTEVVPPDVDSPAVDLVPVASCTDGETSPVAVTADQRGFFRPVDGAGPATADCDAGAVEVYPCDGVNATTAGTAAGEVINGTSGGDIIHAGDGADTVNGLADGDKLCGGAGNDTVSGGAGDDDLDGGADVDTASYAGAPGGVSADLGGGSTGADGDDTLSGFENLTGSPFGDPNLIGNAQANLINGGGGNDNLTGFGGDDDYDGGGGTDGASFEGAPGGVTVNLVTELATGDGGTESLSSIESVQGSDNGPDTITGDEGPNELGGANGDDTITGGGGADIVNGDDGADQLFVRDGVGDQVNCGIVDGDADSVETDAQGVDALANCIAPDVIDFQQPVTPPPTGSCAGKAATVVGTADKDILTGTSAPDVIDAKGGNDTVKGLGGKDLLCGAAGNDKLIGGGGNDTLNGGAGKDNLKGGAGKDKLLGKGGRDRCNGGGGRDRGPGCERRGSIP